MDGKGGGRQGRPRHYRMRGRRHWHQLGRLMLSTGSAFLRGPCFKLSLSTLLQYNLQAALEMIPQQLTLLYSGAVGEETQSPYVNLPAHSSALARLTADGGGGEKRCVVVCGARSPCVR